MAEYTIKALSGETWDAFATLCERNNGAGMGGCWCTWFHNATVADRRANAGDDWRAYKERLVRAGDAHAALVFDGDEAVGWCQFGAPADLPGITHRKEVEFEGAFVPDYRLDVLVRRTGPPSQGRGRGRPGRRFAIDRRRRRGSRRGLPVRHDRQEGVGVLPLQRHSRDVRTRRFQLRPAEGQEPLHHAQDRRAERTN